MSDPLIECFALVPNPWPIGIAWFLLVAALGTSLRLAVAVRNAILSALFGLFAAILVFANIFALFIFLTGAETISPFFPDAGTQFASGYSDTKFSLISPGTSERGVHKLLGEPLGVSLDGTWRYSTDRIRLFQDFAWRSVSVHFNGGVVERTSCRWFFD